MKSFLLVGICLIVGCGNLSDQSIPASLGGGAEGGQGVSSTPYPTTAGGSVYFVDKFAVAVSPSERLEGVASDQQSLFLLTSISVSYNVSQRLIRRIDRATNDSVVVCNFLDTGRLDGGLAVGQSSFYVLGNSSSGLFRRFDRVGCSERESVAVGMAVSQYGDVQLAYDGGALYWKNVSASGSSSIGWVKYDIAQMAKLSILGIQIYGPSSSNWSSFRASATTVDGITWGLFPGAQWSELELWKFGDQHAYGLAKIPTSAIGWASIDFITKIGRTLYLVESLAYGNVSLYALDVGNF